MAYGLFYGMASRNNVLCLFFLLAFVNYTFGETMPILELQPEFLAPLENHTVTQGRDVAFTCVVNHLQSYKVAWIKSDSRAILAIHTHMIAHNPRLSVTHNGHNTWKLHVGNVQQNDSGTYMCQVNTDPMRSQMGYMKVVIPPDIMDLDDSTDRLTTEEGGDLRLRCRATGTPQPDVIWRREDGRSIILRNEHGVKRAMKTYEGEQLLLMGVLRQEMGSYLCIATNGVPPSVSKRYFVHVHFEPLIKVANQLVAAPANSNVILQCYVESSPRALNAWYKDDGAKLLSDDKYSMSEMPISDYAYQMNLTIGKLETVDFGSYTCSSENAFGKADGTIRLQELYLTKTTMSSVWNTEFFERGSKRKFPVDRKNGKYSVTAERQDSAGVVGNDQNSSPSTPMMRGNESKDSKYPKFPGPAPEPAHFVPTQLITYNCGESLRFFYLDHAGLLVISVVLMFRL